MPMRGDMGTTKKLVSHLCSLVSSLLPAALVGRVGGGEDDISDEYEHDEEEGGLAEDEALGEGPVGRGRWRGREDGDRRHGVVEG